MAPVFQTGRLVRVLRVRAPSYARVRPIALPSYTRPPRGRAMDLSIVGGIMDINAIIQLVIVAAVGYSLIALIMPGLRR